MKQFIDILCLFVILTGFSCSRNIDADNPGFPQEAQNNPDSISELISIEELPVPVKEGIHNEKLFEGLNISNIVRITEDDSIYYDMTFRDIDGQLIMVFYNEEGNIVAP